MYSLISVSVEYWRLFVSECLDGVFKVICRHEIYSKVKFLAEGSLIAEGVLYTELFLKALYCKRRTGTENVNKLVKLRIELG